MLEDILARVSLLDAELTRHSRLLSGLESPRPGAPQGPPASAAAPGPGFSGQDKGQHQQESPRPGHQPRSQVSMGVRASFACQRHIARA
jgi:hypothetical protein